MLNPLHPTAHVLTVAATGASGALFTRDLLLTLEHDERVQKVNFIASDNALRVFAEELGIKGRNNLVQQLLGTTSEKIQAQNNDDIGANVASGSYPTHAMIVIPCSMGTLASAGALHTRDSAQPCAYPQHGLGRRSRRDDLPADPNVL